MKMNAVSLFAKTELVDLVAREVDQPIPGDKQVLLKMIAAGVNPMDWESASGPHAWIDTFPHILGNEGVGTIAALGKSVEGFQIGDTVVAYHFGNNPGMFAEFNCVDASQIALLPEGLPPREWAGSPIGILSIYHAYYKRGLPKPGTRVLIEGTGGVGCFAIQWARRLGFSVSVLATERSQSWAMELGADSVFTAESLAAQTAEFDLIFSTLGGTAIPRLAGLLAKNGRFISTMPIQSPEGQAPADFAKICALSMDALFKQCSWEWFLAEPDGQLMAFMLAEAQRLGIRSHVAQGFPLGAVSSALSRAAAGGNRGKIIVDVF